MKTLLTIIFLAYFCAVATFVGSAQKPVDFSGKREGQVFSIGNGEYAGTYQCPDNQGIAQTLTAMGVTSKEITLIRPDETNKNVEVTIKLNLIRDKQIPDTLIRPGDTFYVKRSKTFKVFNVLTLGILGKVRK